MPGSFASIAMTASTSDITYVCAASLAALVGAVCDVRTRRIPNVLTGSSILAGLLLHFGLDGWRGMGLALLAGLIAGVIFLVFHLAGGMGAGDVKLMTAVGCLAGISFVAEMLIATAIAGGVLAVILVVARGRVKQMLSNLAVLAAHHKSRGLQPHPELNVTNQRTLRLPYGLAIAAGCLITLATRFHQG
jgi:prepilin peptidase CpaA